ncbi:carbohydrate esterase family 16 protein [Cucurbitaria berberidis CBS 394.84]|uniref:Carbohydrate esterase family 16 protein n=1 Tax=Cucurbitaria berberidis CBS 394.84 TaxID=1168544 RepID=A0A9P4GD92_9PLEO|nr:carbohydrate esterase family 16 protein [Cucurbitaria berberidis CBS 394.84]KAF1843374.1 carbohydrate esterase family 16 protein [Cucurbitaria berberidis CBS 394.84]
MTPSWSLKLLVVNLVLAIGLAERPSQAWREGKFKTLVTFGDSYTDENRLGYFINNNGSAPPVGWQQPVILLAFSNSYQGLNTASGGLSWARYASIYSKATLYNYAVSGAVCSNYVTPRFFSAINAPFPDIAGYELPAFIADTKYRYPNGTKFYIGKQDSTVYAIWIGTNDLGNNAFLTDSQVKGKTVKDYIDCVYDQVSRLYKNGGRYFVLLNVAPLDLLPQYALPENGGLPATQYFPEKLGKNITEIAGRMQETVAALNDVYKYRTPFQVEVEEKWPDAKFANFDVHALISDIYYHPSQYLNGSAPLNVQGVAHPCDLQGKNCSLSPSPDSFLWYDALHPSEQTGRVVAREFVRVLSGKSKWAEYWG